MRPWEFKGFESDGISPLGGVDVKITVEGEDDDTCHTFDCTKRDGTKKNL